MRLHFLFSSWQRARGALGYRDLSEDVLVFVYPHPAARTFHTFFCPPLRMVALRPDGQAAFDQVIRAGQFVRLPACQFVIECAPESDYRPYLKAILSLAEPAALPERGALEAGASLDGLLFALLSEAVADMRRVREAHRGEVQPEVQRRKFAAWERGQMVASAGFLLDFSCAYCLPQGAVKLSRAVLRAEEPYLDELVAASVAGIPWRHEFPRACMRCGKPGSWRTALTAPRGAPTEMAWRYQRPENALPLCHHCCETLEFLRDEGLRFDLAWGLWGPRFEALWQWHKALAEDRLADWDTCAQPLWPQEFGGITWETGSGALACAEPRPPHGLARRPEHLAALRRGLFSKPFRGRQPGETHLQKLLDFRLETPDGGDA